MIIFKFNRVFISPTIPVYWTKRFVRDRPAGIRSVLRKLKNKNRVTKRKSLFVTMLDNEVRRGRYSHNKPQRRNYNTAYGRMCIPT